MALEETKLFYWGSGAIAVSGVLWFLPGFNAIAAIMAVAGLILITARLGYMRAVLASVIALAIIFSIGSLTMRQGGAFFIAAIYAIIVITPGIVMGAAARGFSGPVKTIWHGFIPILLLLILASAFYREIAASIPAIIGQTNSQVSDMLDRNPSLDKLLSDEYGSGIEGREKLMKELDEFFILFVRMMPGLFVIGFLSILVLGLMIAGSIGARIRVMIPRLPPFYLWRASDWWLVPTAIGLALAILSKNDYFKYAGGNMLVIVAGIYSITGLSVLEALLRRLSIPVGVRLIIYIIPIILAPIGLVFMAALTIVGLLDSRFNFRRENNDKNENFDEITDDKE
jgi:uncharacterized protein YybS (DUF2232 family)